MSSYIANSMEEYPVFFLVKGRYEPDSRNPAGLRHRLFIEKTEYTTHAGESFPVIVEMTNTGNGRWLRENINDIGVVNLGVHLFSRDNRLLNYDFLRFSPERELFPGEHLKMEVPVTLGETGSYRLIFDLVAEQVCWFDEGGSLPVSICVEVN